MSSKRTAYAEIGYKAYGETTGFKNFRGEQMPEWEELPAKIQEAWEAAAAKIIIAHTTTLVRKFDEIAAEQMNGEQDAEADG